MLEEIANPKPKYVRDPDKLKAEYAETLRAMKWNAFVKASPQDDSSTLFFLHYNERLPIYQMVMNERTLMRGSVPSSQGKEELLRAL